MSRARRLIPLTIAFVAALSATGHAAPDWVAPQTIPGGGCLGDISTGFCPGGGSIPANQTSLAVGPDGRMTFGATSVLATSPLTTRVSLLSRLPGEATGEQLARASQPGGALPSGAQVSVGPDGTAAACLTTIVGPDLATDPTRYEVTYRPAGSQTWEAPTTVVTDTVRSGVFVECEPVIGPDGTAALVVRRTTQDVQPRRSQVFLTVHRPDGTWSTPQGISSASSTGYGDAAGVDAAGNVTVAWDEQYAGMATPVTSDDRATVKVATLTVSNGILGAPVTLAPTSGTTTTAPHLGVGDDGTAVVAFQHNGSGASEYQVWAATRDGAAGAWSPIQQLVSDAAASSGPGAAAVAPDGTAYVSYGRQATISSDNQAGLERRPRGGAWSGETGAGPKNSTTSGSELVFVGNDAMFVYGATIGGPGGTSALQAVRWRAGAAAPDGARDLITPGTSFQLDDVDTDHQGGLFANILRGDLGDPYGTSQAIAFDASPPRLVALNVPATAVAGAPVAMSAAFADLWSPLGATTWDFGDGAAGGGDAASHTYAAPGTYAVTARGADALGNAREATAAITVTAAGPTAGLAPDGVAPKVGLTLPSCPKRLSKKACAKRRGARARWRTLRGTVSDAGGSGVARVEIAVARKAGKRLYVLRRQRFVRGTVKTFTRTTSRATIRGARWSLKLPRLAMGTYKLRIRAVDRAGNATLITRTLRLR